MDDIPAGQPAPKPKASDNPDKPRSNRHGRRLQRIREEIERNRTDGPAVPTWVLALILVLIIAAVTALAVFS
jgi:fatty acid desaturase